MPLQINIADAALHDLKARLARTRWPEVEPQVGSTSPPWTYGTQLSYMRDLVAYWRDGYDWRQWERRMNRFSHFTATLDGRRVHYILERGSGKAPKPLLLTHGWPGSFVEFLDIIDPLAHPERYGGSEDDAFTVVAPSLPGFGFSEPPAAPIGPREIARLWRNLMVDVLGFERFVAQGGDWGAIITSWMGLDAPQHVDAIHLNMIGLRPFVGADTPALTEAEREWLKRAQERRATMTAYQQIQGTKPQTLAFGLTDSPAGLAAWIVEKFHDWTIPGEDRPIPIDRDQLLTNISLYWFQGIAAANWIYVSIAQGIAAALRADEHVSVPTAMLLFPKDLILPPPEEWCRRVYNLKRYAVAPAGGHFPAMENGDQLVQSIRAFFHSPDARR